MTPQKAATSAYLAALPKTSGTHKDVHTAKLPVAKNCCTEAAVPRFSGKKSKLNTCSTGLATDIMKKYPAGVTSANGNPHAKRHSKRAPAPAAAAVRKAVARSIRSAPNAFAR